MTGDCPWNDLPFGVPCEAGYSLLHAVCEDCDVEFWPIVDLLQRSGDRRVINVQNPLTQAEYVAAFKGKTIREQRMIAPRLYQEKRKTIPEYRKPEPTDPTIKNVLQMWELELKDLNEAKRGRDEREPYLDATHDEPDWDLVPELEEDPGVEIYYSKDPKI